MLFENYLKNRSLVAKVTTSSTKTVRSERFDITYGTAQGSCLGPLLFILFVNDERSHNLDRSFRIFI